MFILPEKPYPVNNSELSLQFCHLSYPEAENDIEAIDLYCQDFYKKIQQDRDLGATPKDQFDDIQFYGYLGRLRAEIMQRTIINESSFEIKEAV